MPRIIAGRLGGRTVPSPPTNRTRPTSDRVREAVFSRLDSWGAVRGSTVLDLYAGTGALAFEALSRGAEFAVLVEAHRPTAKAIGEVARALGLVKRHDLSGHRKIFCKLFVNKAFDFVQLAFAKRT